MAKAVLTVMVSACAIGTARAVEPWQAHGRAVSQPAQTGAAAQKSGYAQGVPSIFPIHSPQRDTAAVAVEERRSGENRDIRKGKNNGGRNGSRARLPLFLNLKFSEGQVFETNDFVSGGQSIPYYSTASIKFGINSVGNRWQDIAYGMPYYGVAVYGADFGRKHDLGNPLSLYLLQGAIMARISRRVTLNYEWNLGVSFGWKPYDPFDNRENVAIGADLNAHVGLGIYFKWIVNPWLDLHLGGDITHFSNGAQKMPNAGMNMYSVFVEASYNFNRARIREEFDGSLTPPPYEKHFVSDIYATISSCGISVDTTGTNLPHAYVDHKFKVFGMNYSLMRATSYRYRYGIGLDLTYNESAGSWAERKQNPLDGKWYDVIHYGNMSKRFSLGATAKGEVVLPGYSIFANLGWQIYKGNKRESSFFQILGVKVYLKENFFGTFGIRANHFSKAQYLFWSLGYTIEHRKHNR